MPALLSVEPLETPGGLMHAIVINGEPVWGVSCPLEAERIAGELIGEGVQWDPAFERRRRKRP